MKQKRAKVGGEVGINGEYYHGGEFLPNTGLPKGVAKTRVKPVKLVKCQIAPYVWELQPNENKVSIYENFAGVFGNVRNGVAVMNCSDQTLTYYHKTAEEVQALLDRWNNGERWMDKA